MDPLSVTASVIAVATLAWESSKAAYDLVNRLVDAPQVIAMSKTSLTETNKTLDALQQTLTATSETDLNPVLRTVDLDGTLTSTRDLCDKFTATIMEYTSNSTGGRFSKRDRLTVAFRESKISQLNKELGNCQRTISMVLASINLIVTTRTAGDVRRLGDRFQTQEQALTELDMQLQENQASSTSGEDAASDHEASLQLTAMLRKVCQDALSATRAKRTGQKFGDMHTDDQSYAMQGIVGEAHNGVEQTFGTMTTSKSSRAFQGQISTDAFAAMFGKQLDSLLSG